MSRWDDRPGMHQPSNPEKKSSYIHQLCCTHTHTKAALRQQCLAYVASVLLSDTRDTSLYVTGMVQELVVKRLPRRGLQIAVRDLQPIVTTPDPAAHAGRWLHSSSSHDGWYSNNRQECPGGYRDAFVRFFCRADSIALPCSTSRQQRA